MIGHKKRSSGFSLLEMVLTVGVFAMLLISVFNLLQSYAEKEVARATNKYMETVANATLQILSNINNFNALYNAAKASGGGYQLIADSTAASADNITKDFSVSGVYIQASRLLNANFGRISPLRTPVRILLRVADNPFTEADSRSFDVFIVTATPRNDGLVRLAASSAGEAGGWIRSYANKAAATIQHAYGSWNTPISGVAATNWYNSEMQASLNSQSQGSYLVYYKFVNLDDTIGDYLYRVPDTDTAGRRNTMFAPLNAGGHDIVGADDVTIGSNGTGVTFTGAAEGVDTACAGNVLCVSGTASLKGSASTGGNMTLTGSALVADSMQAGSMRIQNGLTSAQRSAYSANGTLVVDGTNNMQDTVAIGTNAVFNDGVTAGSGTLGNITATTTAIPDGGHFTTGTIAGTRRITASTINGRSLDVYHALRAGIVSGGDVSLGTRSAVIDVRNSENLVYYDVLRAPRVSIGTLTVNTFGTCDNGCGQ